MKFYYMNYQVNVFSFINRLGNTSYILRFYRGRLVSGMPVFEHACTVIRYEWGNGSAYYLCADSDGVCYPAPCRMKRLVPGFNWSYVKSHLSTKNVPAFVPRRCANYGK